jgi:hypothetical protein
MNKNSFKNRRNLGGVIFILMIGLTSSILPAIFGKTITVSPMLLFAIIIVSNLPHYIKSKNKNTDEDEDDGAFFSRKFFMNLAISAFLSILVIFIYKFAITFK